MILFVLVQTTLFAQRTQILEKPIILKSVAVGAMSDNVLLISNDESVKKMPIDSLLKNKADIITQLESNSDDATVWNNGKGNLDSNTSFGRGALKSNIDGDSNTAIGTLALANNIDGDSNTALGSFALTNNLEGRNNTSIGNYSLYNNLKGSQNTAIGNEALNTNRLGTSNVGVGYLAGKILNIGSGGSYNGLFNSVFLGAKTASISDSQQNQIVIGYEAIGAGSNTATLGNTNITRTILRGDVSTNGAFNGSNLSGTNTGDNAINTNYSSLVSNATHTGDVTGATVLSLATVNANVGSFGTSSSVPKYTVNAKGLTTESANIPIQIAQNQVNNLVTDLGLKANLTSPTFAGTPTVPTPTTTTGITNKSYVDNLDIQNVKLTGTQIITGRKEFSNSSNGIGFSCVNYAIGSGFHIINESIGVGIMSRNQSTGNGIISNNVSTGIGIVSLNQSTGIGIMSNNSSNGRGIFSLNTSNGNGIFSDNLSTGNSIFSNNSNTGNGIVSNQSSTGTGFNYVGQNNATNTFTVDKFGTTTATTFKATALPVFENNAAATSLSIGQFYRTSTGVLMVKF